MTADGKPTSADNLKQKLAQHLDAARNKLEALKKDIVGMHEDDMDALRKRHDELEHRLDEKVSHTEEAIGSWRKRRELEKLESRAERAEDYAVELVNVAALDFEEAEQAVLDAIAARFDADTASAHQGAGVSR